MGKTITLSVTGGGTFTLFEQPLRASVATPFFDIALSGEVHASGKVVQSRAVAISGQSATQFSPDANALVTRRGQFESDIDFFVSGVEIQSREARIIETTANQFIGAEVKSRTTVIEGDATLNIRNAATSPIESRRATMTTNVAIEPVDISTRSGEFDVITASSLDARGETVTIESRVFEESVDAAVNAVGAVNYTITVVDGGVQPGAEQVFDGEDATAGIPTGADALANFETSAPGEQIKSVTVSVSIDGAAPVVISQNILSVDPTLNSVTFAAGGAGEPDSITLDVAYTGSDTLEATVATLNGATTLETVTVALAVPWDNLDLSSLTSASETADSVEVTVSEANNGGASATVQETVSGLDLTDPAFDSAATNAVGNMTTVTHTENLYGSTVAADWTLTEDASNINITAVSFTEGSADVILTHDVLGIGTTLTVDYSGTELVDAKDNSLGVFSGETVQNNTATQSAMESDVDALYWYNPDVGVTTSGGTLTAWADNTGNGLDLAQIGSAPLPSWNGSAAVFDRTQVIAKANPDFAKTTAGVLQQASGEISIFAVVTLDTAALYEIHTIVGEARDTGNSQSAYLAIRQNNDNQSTATEQHRNTRFSVAYRLDTDIGDINQTKFLVEKTVTQTEAKSYLDGTLITTETPVVGNFCSEVNVFEIGARVNSDGTGLTNGFEGIIHEVYATKTTNAQKRLDIRAELTDKHFGGA